MRVRVRGEIYFLSLIYFIFILVFIGTIYTLLALVLSRHLPKKKRIMYYYLSVISSSWDLRVDGWGRAALPLHISREGI